MGYQMCSKNDIKCPALGGMTTGNRRRAYVACCVTMEASWQSRLDDGG